MKILSMLLTYITFQLDLMINTNYTLIEHIKNISITTLFIYVFFILAVLILEQISTLFLYDLNYFLFKNNNFLKESFYIDWFQKKTLDKFFLNSLTISTQLYNLNFWLYLCTKYITQYFMSNVSMFYNIFTNNIGLTLVTLLYYFIIFYNLSLLLILLI